METWSRVLSYLLSLVDFIVALLYQLWYFIGGIVVGGSIFVIEHRTGSPISWNVIKGVLALGFFWSAFSAWRAERIVKSRITGVIERVEHREMASIGPDQYRSAATVYVRLKNLGAPTSLFGWGVTAKDKYGNDMEIKPPYSQNLMPARSGPPFRTIHDLQNSPLETGVGAEIPIGLEIEGSTQSIDPSTLRVSFDDVWKKKYVIGPIDGLQITWTG
jgi:hypothetical protein